MKSSFQKSWRSILWCALVAICYTQSETQDQSPLAHDYQSDQFFSVMHVGISKISVSELDSLKPENYLTLDEWLNPSVKTQRRIKAKKKPRRPRPDPKDFKSHLIMEFEGFSDGTENLISSVFQSYLDKFYPGALTVPKEEIPSNLIANQSWKSIKYERGDYYKLHKNHYIPVQGGQIEHFGKLFILPPSELGKPEGGMMRLNTKSERQNSLSTKVIPVPNLWTIVLVRIGRTFEVTKLKSGQMTIIEKNIFFKPAIDQAEL